MIRRRKLHIIIPFLFPAILLYAVFVIYPYGRSMYISLTKWRGFTPKATYVGLENFQKLAHDEQFFGALQNNLKYLIFLPVITLIISLYLAFLLTHGHARFSNFYRITFFFPQVMSLVAIGVLWSFVYHPRIGILSAQLHMHCPEFTFPFDFVVFVVKVFSPLFSFNFVFLYFLFCCLKDLNLI